MIFSKEIKVSKNIPSPQYRHRHAVADYSHHNYIPHGFRAHELLLLNFHQRAFHANHHLLPIGVAAFSVGISVRFYFNKGEVDAAGDAGRTDDAIIGELFRDWDVGLKFFPG
jgi:hypothetical protein